MRATRHIRPVRLVRPIWLALLMVGVLVAMTAACTPAATPTPTQPAATQPPRFVTVIVTRTETPAPTATLTPTLPYNIGPRVGTWQLDLTYRFTDGAIFRDVSFIGSAGLTVSEGGAVFGSVELYTTVVQNPCNAAVQDAEPLRATISGQLSGSGDEVVADLTIRPADRLAPTSLWLFCPDFKEAVQVSDPMLWPALEAVGWLEFSVPLRSGARVEASTDLNGPMQGGLRGAVSMAIQVGR